MLGQLALGQRDRHHLDRRLGQHAGLLAFAAARAMVGMHRRQQHGVPVGALVMHVFQGDRLVDDRADPIADIATQAEEIEAGLVVGEHGQAHARFVDIVEPGRQGAGRTGLDAGNVVAHLAGHPACREERRAVGHRIAERRQLQRIVGTIPDAQAATDAGAEKVRLVERAGRAQGLGRVGAGRPPGKQRPHAQQATAAGSRGHAVEESPACRGVRHAGFSLLLGGGVGLHG